MTDPLVARWAEAERILDDVLDLPGGEQAAAAARRCGGDAELAGVVRRLLDTALDLDMAAPAALMASALAEPAAADVLPVRVGPFRVLGELGRGGMGRVLLAVRDGLDGAPRVAIKVLDRAMAGADDRRRFDRERETLARLQHPHIARLFDGGVADDGAPYLVMELVEGAPIDEYCRARRLDVAGRLALMRQVCDAVEYAHGRLVVHRDLKPANVMVDAHGQAKLLDFGIAKWLDELDAASPLTLTMHRVLTPAHAAPEQFTGEPITAATDVYQLGLLLYLLLTGTRAHRVDGTSTDAVRRAACDVDPVAPSRAARDGGDDGAVALSRRLAGDLDAIVLKALRKAPGDRYATVEALRRDLDNHLTHRPVSAHDGTRLYALRKYVRRHRVAVAAGAGVLTASALGLVAVAWQARATALERDRAVAAETASQAVNAFLVNDLLAAPTPERSQGRPITVADVLSNAARSVGVALRGSPAIEAEVREALARSYLALGRYDDARTHAVEARRLLSATRPDDDPAVLAARRLLVTVAVARGAASDVKDEARAVWAAFERTLGPSHSDTLLAAAAYAQVLDARDERALAERVLAAADQTASQAPQVSPEAIATVRATYVDVLIARGRARIALPLAEALVSSLTTRYGATHPQLVPAGRRYARALTEVLEYERAVEVTEAQVRLHEQLYGENHPATAQAVNDLAVSYDRATRDAEALAASERALGIRQRTLGADHPDTMMSLRNVAISRRRAGRAAEALPLYRAVADTYARTLGELNPRAIAAADETGNALLDLGRTAEARQGRSAVRARSERAIAAPGADPVLFDDYAVFLIDTEPADLRDPAKAVTMARRAVELTKRQDFGTLRTLALTLEAAGDRAGALAVAREASASPGGLTSFVTESMVVRLTNAVAPDQVEPWLRARLDRVRRERGPDDYLVTLTLEHLAALARRTGRLADGEALLREKLDVLGRAVPPTHFQVALTKSDLGDLLMQRGALAEAEPLLVAGFEGAIASRRPTAIRRAQTRDRLVVLYERMGRGDDANKYRAYVMPAFSDR